MTLPPDVWLRGPIPGIPPHLQPAAHALLQVREDIERVVGYGTDDRPVERHRDRIRGGNGGRRRRGREGSSASGPPALAGPPPQRTFLSFERR